MRPKQINAEIEALNRKNYTMPQAKKTWANPFLIPSDNKLLATLVAFTAAPQDTKKDMFAQNKLDTAKCYYLNIALCVVRHRNRIRAIGFGLP